MKSYPNTIHNQTNPESIKVAELESSDESSKIGTGIFIIPDPKKSEKAIQSVLVPNLSYSECEQRGQYCIAFKWVANSTMTYEEIQNEKPNCTNDFCPSPSCGPAGAICTCINGNCYI